MFLTVDRVGASPKPIARLHFVNVGVGDSTLIETPCGVTLVDVGGRRAPNNTAILLYLQDFFKNHPRYNNQIDRIILTHSHHDHTRNMMEVLNTYKVHEIVWNGRVTVGQIPVANWLRKNPHQQHRIIGKKSTGQVGPRAISQSNSNCQGVEITYEYLWGAIKKKPRHWNKKEFADENNHSIVTRLEIGKTSILLPGDLESPGFFDLLESYNDSVLDVDILKISHHGFPSGTDYHFVQANSPKIAIISRQNRPWFVGNYEVYESIVSTYRTRPLQINTWDHEHVERGRKKRYDIHGKKIRWGINYGKMSTRTVRKAIYFTYRDGTITIDIMSNGKTTVTQHMN